MISIEELKKLIKERLNEIEPMGVDPTLKGIDLTGLDKMDIAELEMLKHSYKKRGYYTPEEKERIHALQLKTATEKIRLNEPERLANREKAAPGADPSSTLETVPVDWSDPLSGDTTAMPTVDPLARTQAGSSRERTTRSTKKIRKENKIIFQSRLRQIIKEELLVLLTDDEIKEMFGVDPSKEIE
tara:strand:- start:55 stop:612 length:558 start_codon:yes stop_codon:yes gene_type:complete